jgi:hypothetical protein
VVGGNLGGILKVFGSGTAGFEDNDGFVSPQSDGRSRGHVGAKMAAITGFKGGPSADIELLVALEAVADFVDIGDVVPNAIEMPAPGEAQESLVSAFNWGFEPVLGVDDDGSDEEGFTFGQ